MQILNALYLSRPHNAIHRETLLSWANRIDGNAVKATKFLSQLINSRPPNTTSHSQDLLHFFGATDATHPFNLPGASWIKLHERQVTTSLAYFLQKCEANVASAFMRALVPHREIQWSTTFSKVAALSEVATPKGRIDILVKSYENGSVKGAVIEAKFGHHGKGNPFSDYYNFALEEHFGGRKNAENVEFVILGQKLCKYTLALTEQKHAHWHFVSWSDFLRRFEKELIKLRVDGQYYHPQDYNFSQLRRMIWELV